jgi:hypothetical protein
LSVLRITLRKVWSGQEGHQQQGKLYHLLTDGGKKTTRKHLLNKPRRKEQQEK